MPGLRRALVALFVVGVLFAAVDVALVLTSNHEDQKVVAAILGPLIGLSFIGTGVFAWWRRPLNRFGLLMTAVGFAWFVGALVESDNALVSTIGAYVGPLYLVLVVQLVLSFPSGRLETTESRVIVAAAYIDAFVLTLPVFLLDGDLNGGRRRAATTRSLIAHAPRLRGRRRRRDLVIGFAIAAATRRAAAQAPHRDAAPAPRGRRCSGPADVIIALGLVFGGDAVGVPDEVIGASGSSASSPSRSSRTRSSPASCGRATRGPARSAA